MAVLFSAVTITSDSDQAEFLVAGVPKSYADLEGWTAFESFMDEVDTEQDIKVHVAACLYGEGEVFTATPEEVGYFTIRAAETDDFFYDHCTDAGHSDFTIPWSPKELFGMEGATMYDKENHPNLIGHSVNGSKELHSIEDVAKFICENGLHGDVTITYDDNTPFLNTFGIYIDRIADMDYREELLKVLIPMQKELDGTPDFEEDVPETNGMEMK